MLTLQQHIRRVHLTSALVCVFALLISFYAYHVETKKETDNSYHAYCDINEAISCTKALNSEYGRGFGLLKYIIPQDSPLNVPNSIFGILFYIVQILFEFHGSAIFAKVQIAFSIVANLGSIYLGYIMIYKLKTFCAICVTTYIVNAFLLYLNYKKIVLFKAAAQNKSRRKKQ